jgi:hypothetical protein
MKRISAYVNSITPGIKRTIGAYHTFALIRPQSKDLLNSSVTAAVPFSLKRRTEAAISGQKAMRELTGSRGNRRNFVKPPNSQKGTESAKSKPKNFRGDASRDSILPEQSQR